MIPGNAIGGFDRVSKERVFRLTLAAALLCLIAGTAVSDDKSAGEAKSTEFMGIAVEPLSGLYIVAKDVAAQRGPDAGAGKSLSLEKGDRVEAVGRAKGTWLAVQSEGKDAGFVPVGVLLPLIDGAVPGKLAGKAEGEGGRQCDYIIHFEGKSEVEGESFETADYEVRFKCISKGKPLDFRAYMFITEAPQHPSPKPVYQVSVDVLEVGGEYEEVLSVILEYRPVDGVIAFDTVTLPDFAHKPKVTEYPAKTIAEALAGAVQTAVHTWNDKAWVKIAEAAD